MTRSADIDLDWADGRYRFRLGFAQLRELQEKTGFGVFRSLRRAIEGDWGVDEISQTLRLGLIGGGMPPVDALRLTRLYVEARPPAESTEHALAVLMAAVHGVPDEPLGKGAAPATATETSPSNSPPSTATG